MTSNNPRLIRCCQDSHRYIQLQHLLGAKIIEKSENWTSWIVFLTFAEKIKLASFFVIFSTNLINIIYWHDILVILKIAFQYSTWLWVLPRSLNELNWQCVNMPIIHFVTSNLIYILRTRFSWFKVKNKPYNKNFADAV